MVTAVKSFTSEKTYNLSINEQTGVAEDCQCKSRHFNPGKACKHQREFNSEVDRAARFLLAVRQVREIEQRYAQEQERNARRAMMHALYNPDNIG
jgi:hypothetical protein